MPKLFLILLYLKLVLHLLPEQKESFIISIHICLSSYQILDPLAFLSAVAVALAALVPDLLQYLLLLLLFSRQR